MTRTAPTSPSSQPSTIRLKTSDDMLAIVPTLVGFHPRRSLVAVALRPPRRRVSVTMRIDLDSMPAEQLATEVAVRLQHARAKDVLLVLYDPEHVVGTQGAGLLAGQELVHALVRELSARGIGIWEALGVHDGRYRSYRCTDHRCCPPEGSPVLGPSAPGGPSEVAAAATLAGLGALPDRETLQRSVRPPVFLQREAMRQAMHRAENWLSLEVFQPRSADEVEATLLARDQAYGDATVELLKATAARWQQPDASLTDDEAARLILGLQQFDARDRAIVLGASGHRDGPDDTLPLIGVLRELVRRSVPPYGAQVATALGMVAYQYGDGALASVACERALADDPLASGALLLGELIQRQVHPREVRRSSRQAGRDLARRRL